MKSNKLRNLEAKLQRLKSQIRQQIRKNDFSQSQHLETSLTKSHSQRKHFERTNADLFKDVFNPPKNKVVYFHQMGNKKHFQPIPSPRNVSYQKKHFKQPSTDLTFSPRINKAQRVFMRKQMKERNRSRSRSSSRWVLLSDHNPEKQNSPNKSLVNTKSMCFKLY